MKIKPPRALEKIALIVPDKLPLEDHVDRVLNDLAERINKNPLTAQMEALHDRLPVIEETNLNTPLGQVRLPEISAPVPRPPVLDGRQREAMKAAIGVDISSVVGVIPVVGDAVSDVVEDIFGAKIRNNLTTKEMDMYTKYDKLGPSTLAMVRTFTRKQ